MIITRLLGGLGNQMFQYAAGLALAEARRTTLKLDPSWFRFRPEYEAHNRYALSCFNITEQFATAEEVDRVRGPILTRAERWSAAAARKLHFYRYAAGLNAGGNRFVEASAAFDRRLLDQPDPTYLEGMWQAPAYFEAVADLLRAHFSFRYPPTPAVAAMAERIRQASEPVAVHFRRGDYASNPGFSRQIGVLPKAYYQRALAVVLGQVPQATAFVFSDDIDCTEREWEGPTPAVSVRAAGAANAYDELRLMSLCRHAVISNSTFAWWAAWLNPNPAKLVVAPRPWHADPSILSGDILPSGWTALPRDEGAP